MNYKIGIRIISVALIGYVYLISIINKDIWDKNYDLFKKEILSIDQSVETVSLLDVTPFEWDVVYSFEPYTPVERVYETVGYKWDSIIEADNEVTNQIVFLNDGEVVCYIFGMPSNNRFGISFDGLSLTLDDDLDFKVKRHSGVLYLIK
jgi:hypothetical protein